MRLGGTAQVRPCLPYESTVRLDQFPSIAIAANLVASRLCRAGCAGLCGLSHRLDAGDDGGLDRARHQLVDDVREIPLARVGWICGAVALAAISAVLIACWCTGRPFRSA